MHNLWHSSFSQQGARIRAINKCDNPTLLLKIEQYLGQARIISNLQVYCMILINSTSYCDHDMPDENLHLSVGGMTCDKV